MSWLDRAKDLAGQARDASQRAIQTAGGVVSNTVEAGQTLLAIRAAKTDLSEGRPWAALRTLNEAQDSTSTPSAELAFLRGWAHLTVGHVAEAVPHLQSACELEPRHVEAWKLLGDALAGGGGGTPETVSAWERAVRLGLSDPLVHYRLATAYEGLDDLPRAEREMLKFLARPDGTKAQIGHARLVLARAAYARSDPRATIREAKSALLAKECPDPDLAFELILRSVYRLGDHATAQECLSQWLASGRVATMRATCAAARSWIRWGALGQAIGSLSPLVATDADPEGVELLATAHLADRRPAEAIETLRRVDQGTRSATPTLRRLFSIASLACGVAPDARATGPVDLEDQAIDELLSAATAGADERSVNRIRQAAEARRDLTSLCLVEAAAGIVLRRKAQLEPAGRAFVRAVSLADRQRSIVPWIVTVRELAAWNLDQLYVPQIDLSVAAERVANELASISVDTYRLIEEALALAIRNRLTSATRELPIIRSNYERPLILAVMGEFNAGKSTLINAIVGRELLPTGILPTTATANELRFAPEPIARVHYNDGTTSTHAVDEIARYIDETAGDVRVLRRIRRVEIGLPDPLLQSISFIDTPGFGSEHSAHDDASKAILEEADVVLWNFTVHQAGKLSEDEVVRHVRTLSRKVVAVINKIDLLPPDEVAMVRARLVERFGDAFEEYIPVSAQDALEAKLSGDPELLRRSNHSALLTFLRERIVGDLKALKERSSLDRIHRVLDRIREDSKTITASVEWLDHAIPLLRDAIPVWFDKFDRTILVYMKTELDGGLRSVSLEVGAEVARLIVEGQGWFGTNSVRDEDRRYLDQMLRERLAKATRTVVDTAVGKSFRSLAAATLGLLEEIVDRALPDARDSVGRLTELTDGLLLELELRVTRQLDIYLQGRLDGGATGVMLEKILALKGDTQDAGRIAAEIRAALPAPVALAEASLIAWRDVAEARLVSFLGFVEMQAATLSHWHRASLLTPVSALVDQVEHRMKQVDCESPVVRLSVATAGST